MNQEMLSALVRELEPLSKGDDYFGRQIPQDKLTNARRTHQIPSGDYVFFLHDDTFWGSANNSMLATDRGLSFKYKDELPALFLSWKEIDELEMRGGLCSLQANGKGYTLRLCDDELETTGFRALMEALRAEETSEFLDDLEAISDVLELAEEAEDAVAHGPSLEACLLRCDRQIVKSRLTALDKAYAEAKPWQHVYSFGELAITFERARALRFLGKLEQAEADLLQAVRGKESQLGQDFLSSVWSFLAVAAEERGRHGDALVYGKKACHVGDEPSRRDANELLRSALMEYPDRLQALSRAGGEILFCTEEIPAWPVRTFYFASPEVLKMTGWRFQLGHPREDVFYASHPLRPGRFFALEEFHDQLFADKYSELVYLLQSLGADKVHVQALEGVDQSALSSAHRERGVVDEVVTGAGGTMTRDETEKSARNVERAGIWDLTLVPTGRPHLPEDLAWYHHEPSWQRIAQACLAGECRTMTIEFRYQEDFSINVRRLKQVEVDLKLFEHRLGLEHNDKTDQRLQHFKRTLWKITASFPPLVPERPSTSGTVSHPLGAQVPPSQLEARDGAPVGSRPSGALPAPATAEARLEFLADLTDVYEDGAVAESERRMLERSRRRLDISEEEGRKLEEEFLRTRTFTPEEEEYMEDLQDSLADGAISEDERRMLDRRVKRLGLEPSRAAELERLVAARSRVN